MIIWKTWWKLKPKLKVNFENIKKLSLFKQQFDLLKAAIEKPTKYVTEMRNLILKAKVLQIDFEGRSDGESMKKIISNIKPKNLVSLISNS